MDHTFCPGSKILRQPAPEFFTCPSCGEEVEVWTDELMRNCLNCGKAVYRDAGMSCLEWCKHGKDCVGDAVYDTFMKNKAVGIKRCLVEKVREHFAGDRASIALADAVLANAEKLLNDEPGDWHIVIPASILHGMGVAAAETGDESAVSTDPKNSDTQVARNILLRLGLKMDDIDEICELIAHRHALEQVGTDNARVLNDAVLLATWGPGNADRSDTELPEMINNTFVTDTGRTLAREQCAGGSHAEQPAGSRT